MTELPPTEENWPFTLAEEVQILLARCYTRDTLEAIGARFEVDWFEENDISYSNEGEGLKAIGQAIESAEAVREILKSHPPDPKPFDWFRGCHIAAEFDYSDSVLQSGPPEEIWEEIVSRTKGQTSNNPELSAFLKGILDAEKHYSGALKVDYSQAQANGTPYYDDGQLWPQHLVEQPAAIPGISTGNPQSGRYYRVAQEVAPVIKHAIDLVEEEQSGPVPTPDKSVPEKIERRIPKFNEVFDSVEVNEEHRQEFETILDENDALEYWKDYIAPTVHYRDLGKKALLCMLASLEDKHGHKGRTNAIIYGPPGTGKTAFKNFLVKHFGAYSIDGARVSKADLTYNKNTDEDGLLVRAHKGLAVIEEADELDDDALGAALTALGESGQLEIRDKQFPAEVRGLMLGNYRSRNEIVRKHGEAVFDRFEFIIDFDRLTDDQLDETLDWHYRHYRKPKPHDDARRLKLYLAWVREFEPQLTDDAREKIGELRENRLGSIRNVREGISLLSVAATIARLNRRDITCRDFEQAVDLVQGVGTDD